MGAGCWAWHLLRPSSPSPPRWLPTGTWPLSRIYSWPLTEPARWPPCSHAGCALCLGAFPARLPVLPTHPDATSVGKASLETQGQQGPLPRDWLPCGVIQGSGHTAPFPVSVRVSKTGQILCRSQEPHPCSPVPRPTPCLVQIREGRAVCPHRPAGSPVVRPGLTAKASSGHPGH